MSQIFDVTRNEGYCVHTSIYTQMLQQKLDPGCPTVDVYFSECCLVFASKLAGATDCHKFIFMSQRDRYTRLKIFLAPNLNFELFRCEFCKQIY
jgi:hypothetical protein